MFVRTPIFFAPDEPVAGEPAETPAEPVAEATTEAPPVETGLEEIAPETPTTDWEARVTEWGGEEEIQRAIALDQALGTRDGARALVEEAGKALYGSDPAKAALLAQLLGVEAPAAAADPLAGLLGDDPDRLLTAGEMAEYLQTFVTSQLQTAIAPIEERQQQELAVQITSNLNNSLAKLEVPDDIRDDVIAAADRYLVKASPQDLLNPQTVHDALQRGQADITAKIERQAKAYLERKQAVTEEVPTPLVGGSSPGGEEAEPPGDLDEAKRRVRAAMGMGSGNFG